MTICRGRCGRELVPYNAAVVPSGHVRHAARGLCSACRMWATRNGTLADFERTNRTAGELIEEWQLLERWEGLGRAAAAERLGISRNTLDQAISRWRRRLSAA